MSPRMSEQDELLALFRGANPVDAERLSDAQSPQGEALWHELARRRLALEGSVPRRRRRLFAFALAGAVFLLAASPLGWGVVRGTLDRFSAWVDGDPGSPASAEEQAAFEERNGKAYSGFPQGTRLRLLIEQQLAGKRFRLHGFRDGQSLCLHLLRGDRPAGRSATSCVPLRALAGPAVVASAASLQFGRPERRASGVIGFASDDVSAIEVVREQSGKSRAALANNVFMSLQARPVGTVKEHPPRDEVIAVTALLASGARRPLEFVTSYGLFPPELRGAPAFVSYGRWPKLAQLPGPSKIARRPNAGSIGWLERREPRGQPLQAQEPPRRAPGRPAWKFRFARALRPNPATSFQLGVILTAESADASVCLREITPLTRGLGYSCFSLRDRFRQSPILLGGVMVGGWAQFPFIAGLASDAVATLALFYRDGRRQAVSLRDNAFVLQVASVELPGKLVARDRRGRVIGIELLPGPGRVVRCPERTSASRQPLASPGRLGRLDLRARTIAGHKILGRTPAQVITALGRPDKINRSSGLVRALRYGPLARPQLTISFRPRLQGRLVAIGFTLNDANLVERQTGRILRLSPRALARAIQRRYPNEYVLAERYGEARSWGGCTLTFNSRKTNRHVTFGAGEPSWRPRLTVWRD